MKKLLILPVIFLMAFQAFTHDILSPYRWLEQLRGEEVSSWLKEQKEKAEKFLTGLDEAGIVSLAVDKAYEGELLLSKAELGTNKTLALYRRSKGTENVLVLKKEDESEQVLLTTKDLNESQYFSRFNLSPFKNVVVVPVYSNGASDKVSLHLIDLKTTKTLKVIPNAASRRYFWLDEHTLNFRRLVSQESIDLTYNINDDQFSFKEPSETGWVRNSKSGKYLFKYSDSKKFIRSVFNETWHELDESLYKTYLESETKDALYLVDYSKDEGPLIRLSLSLNEKNEIIMGEPKEFSPSLENSIVRILYSKGITAITTLNGYDKKIHFLNKEGENFLTLREPQNGSLRALERTNENQLKLRFASAVLPAKEVIIDLEGNTYDLQKLEKELMIDKDGTQYKSTFLQVRSKDGTLIPMRVTHLASLNLEETHPLLMEAYGGHNIVTYFLAKYNSHLKFFLQRGGVHAAPAARGGGELGPAGAAAAKHFTKLKTYEDVEASLKTLHELGYSTPNQTALMGWSSGGLLVGAVMTRSPELLGLAVPGNGLQDMIRKEVLDARFSEGWSSDYGNHEDSENLEFLASYSPVILAQSKDSYPTTLVINGAGDTRVNPAHSLKFAHALQDHQVDEENPIILYQSEDGGHWPTSVTYQGASGKETLKALWKTIFYGTGLSIRSQKKSRLYFPAPSQDDDFVLMLR